MERALIAAATVKRFDAHSGLAQAGYITGRVYADSDFFALSEERAPASVRTRVVCHAIFDPVQGAEDDSRGVRQPRDP